MLKTIEKKEKVKLGRAFSNNWFLFKTVWKYTPLYVVSVVVEGLYMGFGNSVSVIYTRYIFNQIDRGATYKEVLTTIIIMAVYNLIFWAFHYWYWFYYNPILHQKLHLAMHKDLFSKARKMDLSCYDDPEFYNDFIWCIQESDTRACNLMENIGKIINRFVVSTAISTVLASIDLTVFIITLTFTVATFILRRIQIKLRYKKNIEINPLNKKSNYINRVFHLADYSKELRTSRVSENVFADYDENIDSIKMVSIKYGKKTVWADIAIPLLSNVFDISATGILLWRMMYTQAIQLGDFAAGLNGIWSLSGYVKNLMDRLIDITEQSLYVDKLRRFLSTEPKIISGNIIAPRFDSLTVRGLSFGYGSKEVLHDVDFHVKRGEKIAIVGYNGAGKTTLIKLLMRLYDPAKGSIEYNGTDIRSLDMQSFRSHIGSVFQDYRIYAATLAENVVFDEYDESRRDDVIKALNFCTFGDKLEELKGGISTELTKEFYEVGINLSGGESQKVAIARVFASEHDLIIMDEPSSALDPIAEYELNRRITEYAADKAVIFISHRLSTTRCADRIYMFENGRVIEHGSHDELMVLGGKYADMFRLQAEKYLPAS